MIDKDSTAFTILICYLRALGIAGISVALAWGLLALGKLIHLDATILFVTFIVVAVMVVLFVLSIKKKD